MAERRVLIVGAGGLGREIHSWFREQWQPSRGFTFGGYLDDRSVAGLPVVSTIADYVPAPDDVLVIGIGQPQPKLAVVEALEAKGARFMTAIHESVVIGQDTTIGNGCVLCPNVVVSCNVTLGDFVLLNVASSVGHDSRVGRGTTFSGHADATGNTSVGSGVFLGSHAALVPGAQVGDFAVVGASSLVLRRVPARATVFGVPARIIHSPSHQTKE
jgi:sugar O-acyltransferase (sialic acid O-acetyltransferase NeuD family)